MVNFYRHFRKTTDWIRAWIHLSLLAPYNVQAEESNSIRWICSTEHSFGHSYAVFAAFNNGTFNENICLSSSFMLGELICGQGIIITVTALSGKGWVTFKNRREFLPCIRICLRWCGDRSNLLLLTLQYGWIIMQINRHKLIFWYLKQPQDSDDYEPTGLHKLDDVFTFPIIWFILL